MQPWFTVYFFEIGHQCYDQLTPVKTRYPLISITDHIVGSSLQLACFYRSPVLLKLTADQVLVFDGIVGSSQVNLLKTGQDCLKAG